MHHASASANVHDVPQELKDEIVSYLRGDMSTLLSLTYISLSYQAAAHRELFQRVAFSSSPSTKTAKSAFGCYAKGSREEDRFHWMLPSQNIPYFASLLRLNHFVAANLRDFTLNLPGGNGDIDTVTCELHHALRQLINLRRLELVVPEPVLVRMEVVLADLPFQLDEFCLMDYRTHNCDIDAYSAFISSQSRLGYLHLITLFPVQSSVPIHCPSLHTYIGKPLIPEYVFSGLHNITTLGLVDSPLSNPVPTSLVEIMSSAMAQIRTLVLYWTAFNEADLETLAKNLQALEVLHIVLTERTTTNRLTRRALRMLQYMDKLPRLRNFIWSTQFEARRGIAHQNSLLSKQEQEAIVNSYFTNLSSFETAYFATDLGSDVYLRWSKGNPEPAEVSSLDFCDLTPFNSMNVDRYLAGRT